MSNDGTPHIERRAFLKTTGAAGAALAVGGVAAATPGRESGAKENEVLVGVSAAADALEQEVAQYVPGRAEVVHSNETIRYVAVKFPAEAEKAKKNFKKAITKKEHIKYAEDNATHQALYTPNDPQYSDQYADQMVNAPAAWDVTTGDSAVNIAVIDQGVKYDHPDLSANMSGLDSNHGQDFVDSDEDPYPDVLSDEYHGTHVAGIAAAAIDNGDGVTGIGNSSILSGRALSEDGSGSTADIADAITWASDLGVDVINMSLGGGGYTDTMKNAVSYADDNGVLVICAAGNDGSSSVSYPAAYSECVAISALDPDGSLASYSNYGSEIELCAPGTDVLSTWTTSTEYETISGTSMATPVAAGVAGLTLAQWDLTNSELRSHLKNTAVDMGLSSDQQGSGRVDAEAAVTTDPDGDGGGGGGGGGDGSSTTTSVSDSLSGYWDDDCWYYGWEYSDPSRVELVLDGPWDADFDLYANDGRAQCPSTSDYDYRSWSTNSQESITIDSPDDSTDLYVLVDSYSGSGDYTLSITEYE